MPNNTRAILWKRLKAIHVKLEQNKESSTTLRNIQRDIVTKLKYHPPLEPSNIDSPNMWPTDNKDLIVPRLIHVKEILTTLEILSVDLPDIFTLVDDAKLSVRAALLITRGY